MACGDIPPSKQHLRSYRQAAAYLSASASSQRTTHELSEVKVKASGDSSPPPSRRSPTPSSTRCRTRTPSPPKATTALSTSKAPRSVSPGGTPAKDVPTALRLSQGQQGAPEASEQGDHRRGGLQVRWADALVASVRIRPRTLRKDVSALFYSKADERRFRREAEEEALAAAADEWCDKLEVDSLTSLSDDDEDGDESEPTSPDDGGRHRPLWSRRERRDYAISKAVVVFGDSTKTYGGGGCCAVETLEDTAAPTFSFDDAAFWNGQLTWS